MDTNSKISGVVLIGGKSRRMGKAKAFLNYKGEALYLRTAKLMGKWVDRIYISGKQDQHGKLISKDYSFVPDKYHEVGPMAGIMSVFEAINPEDGALMVIATDMPFVDECVIKKLLEFRNQEKMVTLLKNKKNGFLEPLCAIYERQAYPKMLDAMKREQFALHRIFDNKELECIEYENTNLLNNINYPDQWNKIQ